jgi:lambda family phage portal protein
MISLDLGLPTFAEINAERNQRQKDERRRAFRRAQASAQARSYRAAAFNRLTADWTTINRSTRYEAYRSLRKLRARARHEAQNSDHFKRFLSMVRNNVAGPDGMTLQVRGPEEATNLEIEKAFRTWSHKETASVSGRLSFAASLRLLCTTLARDGEVLVRQIYGKNAFGYSLKFISVNWLDENHNETRPNGNRVIMGVEVDADDKPVQYWLTRPAEEYPGGARPAVRERTPIPAAEIFHIYLPDDENADDDTQTRGIPWAHTAMLRLHHLAMYEEAALIAARAGASKMGFFQNTEAGDEEDGEEEDRSKGQHPIINHMEPGSFFELPPGYEFQPYDPTYPAGEHDPFVKSMLRSAASGLDVSYCSLANDLEGVNFSSIRAGLVEEREVWKALQNFVIESFCRPVFLNWLRSAILAGQVSIRARDFDLYTEPTFQPRRWSWVDPLKDIQAKILAIAAGLDTITDTLAETPGGGTIEELAEKRAKEIALFKEKGIPLTTGLDPNAALPGDEENDQDPPDKKEKKPAKK